MLCNEDEMESKGLQDKGVKMKRKSLLCLSYLLSTNFTFAHNANVDQAVMLGERSSTGQIHGQAKKKKKKKVLGVTASSSESLL